MENQVNEVPLNLEGLVQKLAASHKEAQANLARTLADYVTQLAIAQQTIDQLQAELDSLKEAPTQSKE